jgi:hypothetical protein
MPLVRSRRIERSRKGGVVRPASKTAGGESRCQGAFTIVEVMVAALSLGIMTMALCGCLWSGFSLIQASRENLRATQIMMQRTEAIRLFNWSQILNTNYLKPTFTEYYDPQSAGSPGVAYSGFITAAVPDSLPTAYQDNVRLITISLYWTNVAKLSTIVRSRQYQTLVARQGMQNYIWGGQ